MFATLVHVEPSVGAPRPPLIQIKGETAAKWHGSSRQYARSWGRCHAAPGGSTQSRSATGFVGFDHRLHGLLCGVDDLFHHRRADQEGSGAQRYAIRIAGRHTDPDRLADPPDARHLDRPVRRTHRLHRRHALGGLGHLAADLCLRLPHLPACRAWSRRRRRLICRRHRLRLQMVSEGEPGHRAWHLRRRQCRSGRHQIRRAFHHGGLRLEDRRQCLGAGHRRDGASSSGWRQRTTRSLEARRRSGTKPEPLSRHARAAKERPGLALLALLFLRVRRVCGAGAVAAPLPDRRLRPRHHHRRHDRCLLFGAGLAFPRLRRRALRQVRRAPRDVLDVRRFGGGLLPPVLPADRVHRAGHPRAHEHSGSKPASSPSP